MLRQAIILVCFLGQIGCLQPAAASPLRDPIAESFLMAQAAFTSSAGNAMRQIALRTAAQEPQMAETVRARQNSIEGLARAEHALTEALTAGDTRLLPQLTATIATEKKQLAAYEQTLAESFDGFAALAEPRPLSLQEVRALLEPDEALLFTFVAEKTTFVWFVRNDFSVWHQVQFGQAELGQTVREIRAGLGVTITPTRAAAPLEETTGPTLPEFRLDLTQALYRLILGPVGDALEGINHLLVVTDGPLAAIPFQMLSDGGPEEALATSDPATLRAAPWLIRDRAVTTLPSVEALGALRATPPPPRPDESRLFAMGNPVLGSALKRTGGLTQGSLGNVEAIRALAPLPGTARELRRIASEFPTGATDVLLAAEATEAALKSAASDGRLAAADVIVFATHGLLSGELGLTEPALVLTPPAEASFADDGLLSASEIAGLEIAAGWVVLSACNTAGPDGRADAEGLSGLTRAFLLAGARGMLVSHWPVRDDAAARLTSTAFAQLRQADKPMRRAEALRLSMLELMADESDPSLAHPFAWAPFTMVGEGGY